MIPEPHASVAPWVHALESREQRADAGCAAVSAADHGKPVTVSLSRSANAQRVLLGLTFADREGVRWQVRVTSLL